MPDLSSNRVMVNLKFWCYLESAKGVDVFHHQIPGWQVGFKQFAFQQFW
jgi:hypothetical protein